MDLPGRKALAVACNPHVGRQINRNPPLRQRASQGLGWEQVARGAAGGDHNEGRASARCHDIGLAVSRGISGDANISVPGRSRVNASSIPIP